MKNVLLDLRSCVGHIRVGRVNGERVDLVLAQNDDVLVLVGGVELGLVPTGLL